MTSKARVHAALNHKPVDRVPIFMWFHPETARRLARELEIPATEVARAMGNDVRQVWVGNNYAMEGISHENDGDKHTDCWGIAWVKEGPFNQISRYPLANAGKPEALNYKFPEGQTDELVANLNSLAGDAGKFFIGCDVSPCLFEMTCRLRGMENALADLVADDGIAETLLEQAGRFSLMLAEKACARHELDWLWTGDDVGGQQSMMMSPAVWRTMIRARLAAVVQVGKKHGLWVAYHSCGAIRPIIPDLIEIGVDVLNPIQGNCPGMCPLDLKKEFGKQLAFMGGVDTQELLPRGSADEVRRQVGRLLEGMTADGGGYILAASHTVPPEVPPENIFAMYAAAGISRAEIFDQAAAIRSQNQRRAK